MDNAMQSCPCPGHYSSPIHEYFVRNIQSFSLPQKLTYLSLNLFNHSTMVH